MLAPVSENLNDDYQRLNSFFETPKAEETEFKTRLKCRKAEETEFKTPLK
jgi:hypothetical protein